MFINKIESIVYLRSKGNIVWELFFITIISLIFILFLSNILFVGKLMFSHDTIWYYGLIHYFYNSLSQGVFPYWDPYDYCGQPFYYNLGIARLYEPTTIILVFLNKLIKMSFLTLYHWDFILRIIIIGIGIYLCFREMNKYFLTNILIFMVFLFSSFTFASFRQPGLLTTFMWTPYIIFFLIRLFRDLNRTNFIGFGLFLGLSFSSYQVGYVLTFLSVFLLSFLFFHRDWLKDVFFNRYNLLSLFISLMINICLALPLFSVFIEKDRVVPSIRQVEQGRMFIEGFSYKDSKGGHPILPSDLSGLVIPKISSHTWRQENLETLFSEGALYIGIIPFLLAILGIIYGAHKLKRDFLFVLFATSLLMLGVRDWLKELGFYIFSFLFYAQHMQLFQPFFIFTLLFFVGLGMDFLIDRMKT